LALFVTTGLVLAACSGQPAATPTVDPAVVYTAAAQTVEVQLTSNAALTPSVTPTVPATNTPPATVTPTTSPFTSTPAITSTGVQAPDRMQFVADVSIPDGTVFNPGDTFTKTWRIKNAGSTTWNVNYSVRNYGGDLLGASSTNHLAKDVNPGETIDISIGFTAPSTSGQYTSIWVLTNDKGQNFGTSFWAKITVGNAPTSTPTTAAATAAPTSTTTGTPTH
jgi:hypothetical protein